MKCSALLLLVALVGWPQVALAQEASLNEKQTAGRNLFAQHCVVCHVKTQLSTLGHYGPALSRMSVGGQEDVMREVIGTGTPNMPGFKYMFKPEQIEAIAAYIKTLPVPPPAPPPAAPAAPR
jgi:mono/diheme cytochrome c family protein